MNERMKSPALVLDVNPAIQSLQAPIYQSGLPVELLGYVGLRVGQLTSCKFAINQAFVHAEGNAVALEHLNQVLDWKTSEAFSPSERTALELTEAVTERMDDTRMLAQGS